MDLLDVLLKRTPAYINDAITRITHAVFTDSGAAPASVEAKLDNLLSLLKYASSFQSGDDQAQVGTTLVSGDVAKTIIEGCITTLHGKDIDSKVRKKCVIILVTVSRNNQEFEKRIVNDAVNSIKCVIDVDNVSTYIPPENAIHILCDVVSHSSDGEAVMISCEMIKTIVIDCNEHLVGYLLGPLLTALCTVLGDSKSNFIHDLLKIALSKTKEKLSNNKEASILIERQLMIICAVSTELFLSKQDSVVSKETLNNTQFWSVIQAGFSHENTLSRKRSLYIVKMLIDVWKQGKTSVNDARSVFWWSAREEEELSKAWELFILLIETLEEKQVHVLRPVMPKMPQLVQSATPDQHGTFHMHTSWITTVLERIAQHESSYIRKWGMEELLKLDLTTFPLLQQSGYGFLTGAFVSMLTENSHYHKLSDVSLGTCSPIADELCNFLKNLFSAMIPEQTVPFLADFITSMDRCAWSGSTLVYVSRALSTIPPFPRLTESKLASLSHMMSSSTNTLHVKFRSAIHQYLTIFVMNNIDQGCVSPWAFGSFLEKLSLAELLQRGTHFWGEMCNWFAASVNDFKCESWSKAAVVKEMAAFLARFMKVESSHEADSKLMTWVRLVCLLVDAHLLDVKASHGDEETSLITVLAPVLSTATTMGTHAYMTEEKARRTVFALSSVIEGAIPLQGCESDELCQAVTSFLSEDLVASVLQYMVRYVDESVASSVLKTISVFTDFISLSHRLNPGQLLVCKETVNLVHVCRDLTNSCKGNSIQKYCSMSLLSSVCAILPDTVSPQSQNIHRCVIDLMRTWKVTHHLEKGDISSTDVAEMWGRVSSQYIEAQWQCLIPYIKYAVKNSEESLDCEKYAAFCLDTLDVAGAMTLVHVFRVVELILPKISEEAACSVLRLGWLKVNEETQVQFWTAYHAYMTAVLQSRTLAAQPQSPLFETLAHLFEEVFRIGEEKEGLINSLVFGICQWWMEKPENLIHANNYVDLVMQAVVFGPVHSKGKRFQNEVHQYLLGLGNKLALNQLVDVVSSDDSMVRVCVLTMLAKLKPSIPQHKEFALVLIRSLVLKERELVLMNSYKQYTNSLAHRHKHRVFTALLILQPFFHQMHEEVYEFLLEVLRKENQSSVRCQAEIMLQTLALKHQRYIQQLWRHLEEGSEKKPVFMCSLMAVMSRLATLLTGQLQTEYILEAIPRLLPWAMTQQFSLRTHAQGALLTLWRLCEADNIQPVLHKHALLASFVTFAQTNPRASKVINKLLSNFPFQIHPFQDLSIQTLVSTLPWLACMTDEEWMRPELFEKTPLGWSEQECSLPLWNSRPHLLSCTPGSWKVVNFGRDDDAAEAEAAGNGDVQKKAIPWIGMLPQQDLETDLQDEYAQQRTRANPLIVVASLIDKIPNLGGLCRTSEIFGVSEYVIGSLRYLADVAFSSLSMTAHKWLPIREVKPTELRSYLVDMKEEGYTLVGAEQTANSVCLTQYTFPQKTLLLLGNEKEGIPVDLIQLLDVCVEIPQQGLVRSLNVHVSGALLVWEYTRQQLVNAST